MDNVVYPEFSIASLPLLQLRLLEQFPQKTSLVRAECARYLIITGLALRCPGADGNDYLHLSDYGRHRLKSLG